MTDDPRPSVTPKRSPDTDEPPRRDTTTAIWTSTAVDEGRRWRRHLDEEIRPLVDSLRRLRERDLLD